MLERFEWLGKIGELVISAPRIPVRWRGCSSGCLSFLEVDEEQIEVDTEPTTSGFHGGAGPEDQSFEFSDEEDE